MAIECLVITFILGAIVFSFARADRIRWVIATVPLGILPLANCVSCFVCTAFLGCELPKNIAAVILLLAVMASCVWIGIASGFLRTNRMRIPYICVGIGFNVVLGLILRISISDCCNPAMKRRFTAINEYRTAVNFYGGIFIFTLYPHPSIVNRQIV